MFVDPTHPADLAAVPAAEVEPAPAARPFGPVRARLRSRRALWRTGAALLALAAYGASAQLATNEVVVKPGDTLTKIAGTYRTSVNELVAYNDISDPNVIVIGQTIAIPPGTGELRHDVRAGENLTSIAATYGTTVDAILKRNNLVDANKIRIGQTLVVPRAAAAPAAPVAPPPTTTAAPRTTAPAPAAPPTTAAPAAPAGTATNASLGTPTAPVTAPGTTAAPTTTAAAPATTAAPTVPPTTGPTATIPRITVPSGGAVSTMWVVQPGDTIASIAARFGLAPRRLASVNALSESDELVPGQRIYVPQS